MDRVDRGLHDASRVALKRQARGCDRMFNIACGLGFFFSIMDILSGITPNIGDQTRVGAFANDTRIYAPFIIVRYAITNRDILSIVSRMPFVHLMLTFITEVDTCIKLVIQILVYVHYVSGHIVPCYRYQIYVYRCDRNAQEIFSVTDYVFFFCGERCINPVMTGFFSVNEGCT